MAELTPKQALFIREYLVDLNATQAAIRAGYSEKTAYSQGQRLLKDVEIAAAVQGAMDKRGERTEITADRVLKELWDIATADPNELIQFRRGPCDKCWDGYTEPPSEPDTSCLACRGEGVGRGYVADTRLLTGSARKLYAGVKITKEGIEVKMHDKAAALVNVGRHLGMFTDKVEHSGEIGLREWLTAAS